MASRQQIATAQKDPARGWITSGSIAVIAVMGLLLLWSRLANLQTSLWHDEVVTVLDYVRTDPSAAFERYVPNNHVLFSSLTWATAKLFGDTEAIYRAWSVLPGLAAVAVAGAWTWRRFGPPVSAVTVTLAAVSPIHLVLTPQARGYGLAMLAATVMLVAAVRVSEKGDPLGIVLFGIAGFVGIATLPVVAPAFLGHVGVLLARRASRRSAVWVGAIVMIAALGFYAPLLGEILESSRQHAGDPLPWHGVLTGPLDHLLVPTVRRFDPTSWNGPGSEPFFAIAGSVLVGLGAWRLWRRNQHVTLACLIVPVLTAYAVLAISRVLVAPRFLSFLLLYPLVLVAVGVVEAFDLVRRLVGSRVAWPVVATALLLPLAIVGGRDAVRDVNRQARLPYENTKQAGLVASSVDRQPVITNSALPDGLRYYVGEDLRAVETTDELDALLCEAPAPFVFIDHSTERPHPEPNVECLRRRGAVLINVPQQENSPVGRRGTYDVWIVNRPAQ